MFGAAHAMRAQCCFHESKIYRHSGPSIDHKKNKSAGPSPWRGTPAASLYVSLVLAVAEYLGGGVQRRAVRHHYAAHLQRCSMRAWVSSDLSIRL